MNAYFEWKEKRVTRKGKSSTAAQKCTKKCKANTHHAEAMQLCYMLKRQSLLQYTVVVVDFSSKNVQKQTVERERRQRTLET